MEAPTDVVVPMRRPFDPTVHDLDAGFRLARFADLKGLGCKVPAEALKKFLEPFREQERIQQEADAQQFQYAVPSPRIGANIYNICLEYWLN